MYNGFCVSFSVEVKQDFYYIQMFFFCCNVYSCFVILDMKLIVYYLNFLFVYFKNGFKKIFLSFFVKVNIYNKVLLCS